MTEPDRRPEMGARALRLVLAAMQDDWHSLDTTMAEITEHDIRPTMQFLAGLAAHVWALCSSTALEDLTKEIGAYLDAAADQHREDHA